MDLDQHGNELGKIFVGGLHQSTKNESLENYFSNFGEIEEALVMMDNSTNRSRGFGYVKFKDTSSVDNVLAQKQHIIDFKEVDPKRCNVNMKGRNRRLLKIFVGGIAISHNEEIIRKFFSQFGQVTEVNLLTSPEKDRHRGFAFVGFKDEAVVKYLISLHFLPIQGKQVEIKAMQPPSLRKNVNSYQSNKVNGNNGSLSMRNNAIFGKVSMKNPLYRTNWMDWNGFSQNSGPNEWSNPNTAYPPNPPLDSSGFPQTQVNSNNLLHAMMWPNVTPSSAVDPVGITSSTHPSVVSQASLYHNSQGSQDKPINLQVCPQPQIGYNRGRNWSQDNNRHPNQTQNSYYIDQQQNAIMQGLGRNNGTSCWNQGNSWSNNQNQGYSGHSNIQNSHPPYLNNASHSQGQNRQANGIFENWSSMSHQLNKISNNALHHDHQSNSTSNNYSHNQFNRYMNPQYHSQKSMYSDDLVTGATGYSQNQSPGNVNNQQFFYQNMKNSRISFNPGNNRRLYQKNYINPLNNNNSVNKNDSEDKLLSSSNMIIPNNNEQFPVIESTTSNSNNTNSCTVQQTQQLNGREPSPNSHKMHSSSNSDASSDCPNGGKNGNSLMSLSSTSVQNNSASNNAIISSSTTSQIPIPSH